MENHSAESFTFSCVLRGRIEETRIEVTRRLAGGSRISLNIKEWVNPWVV